ncbi:MAG: HAMP domain-containing sensor histidine kinase [Bacteroidales bacterium]|jgi:signal transduction histidine kinase|nr:HAMP domain-containing sensor histidine kinase [Bacteroidales bacterium]
MKLLTKTSLNFLSITLFIFLFGIVAFYFLLRGQVNQNINLDLEKRKASIIKQLNASDTENRIPPNPNERIIIDLITGDNKIPDVIYTDTLIFDVAQHRYIPFRKLGFITTHNNQRIYIRIFKSLEESDLLIVRIFLMLTVLFIALIVTLLIMNRITLKQSWKIFYNTINNLSNYNVNKHEQFALQESEIKEFEDLNRVIQTMTDRINADYINLKEFTENASHEIQNPLAIINSKMELLLQSGDLSENHYKAVVDAYEASNRISRLNKTLILLAKIENRQFPESEEVNIKLIIDNQLELLEDIIDSKSIITKNNIEKDFSVMMNPYLAEILFMNLIKNAIRHNVDKGQIIINQTENTIEVSNTGPVQNMNSEDLFKRFRKFSNSSESLGLGLSIVKKISEVYDFHIFYEYNNMHRFFIKFNDLK